MLRQEPVPVRRGVEVAVYHGRIECGQRARGRIQEIPEGRARVRGQGRCLSSRGEEDRVTFASVMDRRGPEAAGSNRVYEQPRRVQRDGAVHWNNNRWFVASKRGEAQLNRDERAFLNPRIGNKDHLSLWEGL